VSASLETYLVKLYLDRDARRAFPADPHAAAARSFARTHDAQRPRGWARLLARWRAWRWRS